MPCISSSLEVMQCTPIGVESLVTSRKWFPFRFCFVSSSEICMSRSYDFSLPLINFSIYSADHIPDSVYLLKVWALDRKGFHEFGRFSLNMTTLLARPHWARDLSGGELTVVFSYERWDNITSVQRNLESQTLAILKLWWAVYSFVILKFLLLQFLNLYESRENSSMTSHALIIINF